MSEFGLRAQETDPVDAALPDHLRAVHTGDWLNLIFRMDIPTKRYGVAVALARFASVDGSDVRPGLQKVADMAKMDVKNAGVHVKALVALGMLAVKRKGGGRAGNPTLYRLTRPADITTLPLWLDPDMNRVPAEAAFVPAEPTAPHMYSMTLASGETGEHRAPTPGEPLFDVTKHRALAPDEYVFATGEYRAPTPDESPVDNPVGVETPGVRAGNTGRFEQKHRAPAPEDLTITRPTKDLPGSSQVTTSPDWRERGPAPATLAALIGPPTPEPWTPPPAAEPPRQVPPPRPAGSRAYAAASPRRTVHATATLAPTPEAAEAFAVLAALPGRGEWYLARAGRELRREGALDPAPEQLALRAAAIVHRTDLERSA